METLKPSKTNIARAVQILKHGGVVMYPTETSYALGADARKRSAVAKIFKLKGRTKEKTFPLIVTSKLMAHLYSQNIRSQEDPFGIGTKLEQKYWPGPLTIVAPLAFAAKLRSYRSFAANELAPGIRAKNGTIALRVSSHPVARALSRGIGGPIIATSANRAGEPSAYTVKDALKGLHGTPDLVLDAGRLPRRRPSTIVQVVGGKMKILRQGSIKI